MSKTIYNKTVIEFFAGIGLMRDGLEKAGWSVLLANDIDITKRKLYLNHFNDTDTHFVLEDIHKLQSAKIPTATLATASFPCTDLSLAGRRAGLKGKHSSAFWGFVDILKGLQDRKPPLILLENVAGFITSNNGQDFRDALIALNEQGYLVDAFIIDASHFVPQSRVRLFIVGKLGRKREIKINRHYKESELRPSRLLKFIGDNSDIRWDINHDLPELPALEQSLENIIESISKGSALWWSKERVDYLLNQTFDRHLIKMQQLVQEKTYSYLTAFRRVRDNRSMAEIRFDGIAGCLRTPKGGSARQILLKVGKGEINVRLLTPRECARLMGADNFKLSGTVNEALFGFGDAVCVPVVSWIAKNYLNEELNNIINKQEQTTKMYAESA